MAKEEILIVRKERDKLKVKAVNREFNSWSPSKYEKIIPNKDFNQLALLLFDLNAMGYNISKAFEKFRQMTNEPELFFLR